LLLPLEFCRLAVRKGGFAVTQFQWPAAITQPLTRSMWWTEFTVLPLFFFWRIFDGQTEVTPQLAASAQLLFIAMTAIASLVLWRLIHPRSGLAAIALAEHPGGWLQNLRWLWHPLIAAIPLALGVLAAFGYSYSAAVLALRLYRTIWLLIVAGVLLGFLLKWLSVSRGRLLLKQLRERSAPQSDPQATGVEGEGVEIVDETQPDLSAINDQTRRLIIATLVFFVLFGVYLTWSPVLPALQFLQRFTLWPIEDASGEISYITLANVLAALPLVVVTVVLFRNLPGLLETTLLQRLPLENAVRYAITTLVSYAIAGVGIVATALTLGLRWDSIQWLVAGLGVGLGFGLQEIFANFISGIILLFEQPIRVGDIVTVDSTTGVVSRIRMRATTITNWDRQEYVVPNRDFITGRLTNWTLTDSTNRVVINVGVAYGSDTARACQILQELCAQNNHVLEEPAPLITFEGFGDSTLNLVLRFYLPTLDNRLGVIHQMHTAIHDRFNAEGIEIAFPQRDLHVRSLPPELPMPSQAERATAGERSD
jgi:potassium efflux system protein